MKKFYFTVIVLLLSIGMTLGQTIKTIGPSGADYATLKLAFDAVNSRSITGNIIFKIIGSTTETATARLASANYSSILIYSTSSGLSISGNLTTPLVDFNDADNVTIDGRVNGTGTAADLTIVNSNATSTTGTSTIRFINDASYNTIKYCTIKGSSLDASAGVIFFSTAATTLGNKGNTIDNNNITNAGGNRAVNSIFSLGSAGIQNSSVTISNNNIYDFLNPGNVSYGINLSNNTTTWSILDNSFFETTAFSPTANVTHTPIYISSSTGSGFIISGNYIGGSAARCGGSPWTKVKNSYTNTFYGISLNTGTGTANSLQGNVIKNFDYSNASNAANWYGIYMTAGSANVGTTSGNVIGASSGNSSIKYTAVAGNSSSGITGIFLAGTQINVQNNTIGSITYTSLDNTKNITFNGIYGNASSSLIINGNLVGSTDASTTNSINSTTASSTNSMFGIGGTGTASTITISNNTVSQLSSAGCTTLVGLTGKLGVITNNTVHDLSSSDNSSAIYGISTTSSSSTTSCEISGNTVYNLSNSNMAFSKTLEGIQYNGTSASGSACLISRNFIHDLSLVSGSNIIGVNIVSGSTLFYNNIISLSGNNSVQTTGIKEYNVAGDVARYYFNTIYIGGSLPSGSTSTSYCFYSSSDAGTRLINNNLFINTRSTTGGSNLHYAMYLKGLLSSILTCDYNNYLATGTGGVLGYFGANKTTLPIVTGATGNDGASLTQDPQFANAGGGLSSDYYPSNNRLAGVTTSGVTVDYNSSTRASNPTMGALEGNLLYPVEVWKAGVLEKSYIRLKQAFDAINAKTHTGDLTIKITDNTYETSTSGSARLATANYSSVLIYPTSSGLSISGNLASPLIDFNNADNVTIDGRVNGTGTAADLTIVNSNATSTTGTSTIRFINDATYNTIKYCTIKGSSLDASAGVIFFSTAATTLGNKGNTIDNNNITNAGGNRAVNSIFSLGSAGMQNSSVTISNNNIYDFLNPGNGSYGINLSNNTTTWSILGNSFFETTAFSATAQVTYIPINISSSSGSGFIISGNYIGGSAARCGGSPWTKVKSSSSNPFYGISLNTGTGTANSLQGNIINNFNYTNADVSVWYGINMSAGSADVGTTSGNVIGASSGNGSIQFTQVAGGVNSSVYGLFLNGSSINIKNDTIGSITMTSLDNTGNISFQGIYGYASTSLTISGNLIGSTDASTTNSINSATPSTGVRNWVIGICINTSSPSSATVSNNIVSKINNATLGSTNSNSAPVLAGIWTPAGVITNNIVRDLSSSDRGIISTYGILISNYTGSSPTVTDNIVYNISNNNSAYTNILRGIHCTSNTAGTYCLISRNYVHDLSVVSGSIYGASIAVGSPLFCNNIINLSGNNSVNTTGIFENSNSSDSPVISFNTVYIGGNLSSGSTSTSHCFNSTSAATTRKIVNNLFVNARSTTGGSNLHYAMYLPAGGTLTCNYNDYLATGTGGVLGYYGGNKTTLPIVTGGTNDANSMTNTPGFSGTSSAKDFIPSSMLLKGSYMSTVTSDYQNKTRSTTAPTIGAFEAQQRNSSILFYSIP